MSKGWVLARTQSNREKWAAENIMRQGAEYYLPKFYKEVKKNGRTVEFRAEYLFPNYIFVRAPGGRWRWLTGTFGISKVVQFGEYPAIVPDLAIQGLRQREDEEGLIRLPQRPSSRFNKNQAVVVREGALAGHRGLYQDTSATKRARFLISMLGRSVMAFVPEEFLEAA